MNEFYVGYLPSAPEGLRRFLRKLVQGFLIVIAVLALVLVKAQKPFAASAFEFQQERDFDGIIEQRPYPALLVQHPGSAEAASRYLLVAPGKHGADSLVHAYAGRRVHLKGKLIYREEGTMIEVVPGSLQAQTASAREPDRAEDLGFTTLIGEIVDTKCFLGVMNPGSGKVHRECAARCLSGGIPAAFLAESAAPGENRLYVLTSADGGLLPSHTLLQRVGERMTIAGHIVRIGSSTQFRVDPRDFQNAE